MYVTGQKVVCINDDFPPQCKRDYWELPKKNSIYTIRSVEVGINYQLEEGQIAVTLKELRNPSSSTPPHRERGFLAERFAPLQGMEDEAENINTREEVLV
ncbi:MAG: hypothetical protein EB120_09815 [Proteobacteria bacterium]|nr:hypothetical protein [Pseudomonadota bacterium]